MAVRRLLVIERGIHEAAEAPRGAAFARVHSGRNERHGGLAQLYRYNIVVTEKVMRFELDYNLL